MGYHLTARLAWHADGWDGRICKNPEMNTYCVGTHSFPGEMIATQRDVEWEKSCAGKNCSSLERIPPCVYSINAFGSDSLTAYSKPPEFFNRETRTKEWQLRPATVCIWPYEEMYRAEVRGDRGYDASARKNFSDEFFSKIEKNSSLIFYYANYSNPYSTGEESRYTLVGLSRVADVGPDLYYDGCSAQTIEKYGGYVWDRTVSSTYPDEGLRLPYHLYKDDPQVESFLVHPENAQLCKYGSKLLSDDEALGLVEQFSEAVSTLISIGDLSENWSVRKRWLDEVISELWHRRGAYPGMPEVCAYLQFHDAIRFLKREVNAGREVKAVDAIWNVMEGKAKELGATPIPQKALDTVRRAWKLTAPDDRKLLRDVLCRIDLDKEAIKAILEEPRIKHGLRSSSSDILRNPYLISEQYVGKDAKDRLTWAQLDRAALPSPDLGVPELVSHDSASRLRALACECLSRVSGHTFLSARDLASSMNRRLERLPEWKQVTFKERYFEVDEQEYLGSLHFRDEDGVSYVYSRDNYEAEQLIETQIRSMMQRPEIGLKIPMTETHWREYLFRADSPLAEKARVEYEQAIATQVSACENIFTQGFAVLCGAAGTGKTTALSAIVKAIRRVDGQGSAVIALAPTGKAADRAREIFQSDPVLSTSVETATIHAFLAKLGWINDNYTFRAANGDQESSRQTIIIDECSMLDLRLFATLFRAIKWSTVKRLILVGDPNQLPPIGTGRVFADIVEHCRNTAPRSISELTANLRQLENSVQGRGTGIVRLASLFRESGIRDEKDQDRESAIEELLRQVQAAGDVDKDLRVVYWQEPTDLSPVLLRQLTDDMASDTGLNPRETPFHELWTTAFDWRPEYSQILSPYRGELYGIEAINLTIQAHKSGEFLKKKGSIDGITLFDKVIQVRNRTKSDPIYGYYFDKKRLAQCDVFNGELGFVKPHGYDDNWRNPHSRLARFSVSFSRKANIAINYGRDLGRLPDGKYLPDQRVEDNLELGYAISVHKAQGSEFDRIYIVIPAAKRQLLSQELIYTALTRGKRHCTLLIQKDASSLVDMRRRERCWLSRINSSLFAWHRAPAQPGTSYSWYEAGKIHEALTGDMVRSKSEVIIANMLEARGVKFSYEKPLFAPNGTMYLPDFTLIWNGEELYWEHVGRISDSRYLDHWNEKLAWYEKFFPGKLRVTYERSNPLSPEALQEKLDISRQASDVIDAL